MQAGLATRRLTLRDIFVSLRSLLSSLSDLLTLAHSRRMAAGDVPWAVEIEWRLGSRLRNHF